METSSYPSVSMMLKQTQETVYKGLVKRTLTCRSTPPTAGGCFPVKAVDEIMFLYLGSSYAKLLRLATFLVLSSIFIPFFIVF